MRPWTVLDIARPKGEKKLPVVLSRDEVWRILDAVRLDAYRVCRTTMDACGLRLMEGIRLQVPDIDGDRTLLHIHGKRGKDRYVPLPDATLALLRTHWRTPRNPLWLFPAPLSGARIHAPAVPSTTPITRSSLQSAFVRAVTGEEAPADRELARTEHRRRSACATGSGAASPTASIAGAPGRGSARHCCAQ